MWLKRKSADAVDLEALRDISDDVIESDFVPYACLYDSRSILTKDGQLMQTIKISGLDYDAATDDASPLRTALRQALRDAIPSTDYAIWLHTMRRRVRLTPQGHFPDSFSTQLHEKWRDVQQWDNAYINEIYVSIVKEHQCLTMKNPHILSSSFWPKRLNAQRTLYLDAANAELHRTCDAFCARLKAFSAKPLGLVEREDGFHHEGVDFLCKLINLQTIPMPLSMADLAKTLTPGDITFGHNAMEVRAPDGKRRFAALLTIKEYKEASLPALDQFLEIPCELIMSQCFDFVGETRARETYELQGRYLKAGGDKDMMEMSEIVPLVESGRTGPKNFGESQTSMFVIAPSVRELENNIRMIRRALSRIGIVSVREDLLLEDTYWAQLPANLHFTRRMLPISTSHLGGFTSLQSVPMGNPLGSPWGPPVTLFPTVGGTPYFFNFHRGATGHTTVIGPKGAGKTTLLHFLLTQARKLDARIWYIDMRSKTGIWANAAGGTHHVLSPTGGLSRLSPLTAPDSPEHREFLSVWLTTLVDPTGQKITRANVQFFRSLVDQLYSLPPASRSLSTIAQQLSEVDMLMAGELKRWCEGGPLATIFDNPAETVTLGDFTLLDIGAFAHDPALRIPIASYLLHRMTSMLDGRPTMIVLDEAWHLLANPLFASRIEDWMDYVAGKNAITISTTEDITGSAGYPFASRITAKADTQLYLPDGDAAAEYMSVFGLNDTQMLYVQQMRASERHVLIKRGRESAVLKADLAPLGDMLYTLASTVKPVIERPMTAEEQLARLMGWEATPGREGAA